MDPNRMGRMTVRVRGWPAVGEREGEKTRRRLPLYAWTESGEDSIHVLHAKRGFWAVGAYSLGIPGETGENPRFLPDSGGSGERLVTSTTSNRRYAIRWERGRRSSRISRR